jgi:GGDEF domain-containing protein
VIERLSQSFFLPTVLFGFAFFAALNEDKLPDDARLLIGYLPYVSLLLVAVVASTFNRGRSLLAACFALMILLADQYTETYQILPALMLIFVPLNLALLAWLPERGTSTAGGLVRIVIILSQVLAVYYLAAESGALISPWLNATVINAWPEQLNGSQLAVVFGIFSLLLTLSASYFSSSPINESLFGANIGVTALLMVHFDQPTSNAFLFTIAVVLAVGLLRDYYNMAYRDELTGLPQRRALNESMTSLGGKYCIAMLDVDHFKKFNDTHGHDVGDQVLQMVAAQIRKVQGGGKAYRYGGEEFTIVFNSRTTDDAVYFLDQVRKNIESYEMVIRDETRPDEEEKGSKKSRKKGSFRKAEKKVSVTISIGVCERERGEQPEQVLKRADEALYRAKKAGRNRVAT